MTDPGKGSRWLVFVLLVGALMLVGTAMAFADEARLVLAGEELPTGTSSTETAETVDTTASTVVLEDADEAAEEDSAGQSGAEDDTLETEVTATTLPVENPTYSMGTGDDASKLTITVGPDTYDVDLTGIKNHGGVMGAVNEALAAEGISGRMHGKIVSMIAKSGLGKQSQFVSTTVTEPVDETPTVAPTADSDSDDGPVVKKSGKKSSGPPAAKEKPAKSSAKGKRK